MSFKPQGASLPAKFKKANTNSNTFRQRPKDRLCVVDGFNTEAGIILATEVDTNRKIEAKINPDKTSASANRTIADKWSGDRIDERMEKFIDVSHRIVLEACQTEKNLQRNGQDVSLMRANWISTTPDPSPEKSFYGIYTVNAFEDRVVGVQHWEAKSINPSTEEGEAAILDLGERMDKVLKEFHAGEYPVALGVQFRTLVKVENDRDGNPIYEVVDSSPPFDWIRAEKDADGTVIKAGHPLDREHLEGYLDGYLDYVYGSQNQDQEGAEPGLIARGIIAADKEESMVVEVMPYRAFQAAPLSKDMALRNERTPLYRLSNVMTKYGQQDENGYVGKNWAVDGIVVLTSDQAPKNKTESWRPRNLVTRVYTNGFTGNVHSLVKAFDGGRARPHPLLDRVRDAAEETREAEASASRAPQSNAPALTPAPALTASQNAFDDDDDQSGNYFAAALSQVGSEEVVEQEAAPAAEPEAEAPKAADKDGGSARSGSARFRRTT